MNVEKPINPDAEDDENEKEEGDINFDDLDSGEEVIEIDLDDINIDLDEKKEESTADKDKVSNVDTILDDIIISSENVVSTEEATDAGNISKHKQSGKHSLQYDTIFKGKKTTNSEEELNDTYVNSDNWMPDVTTNFHYEVYQNEKYVREQNLKEKIYTVLLNKTEIDFDCNRRKPSRVDFNNYFFIVKTELQNDGFSNVEIFNELAYYFSDNLMNMFKLLDNKWRNLIIDELQDHIGKINSDKTICHKNMPLGSEIEFNWQDPITLSEILITGEIRSYDEISETEVVYIVNSYENEYRVDVDRITKVLNNTKFKYNLNKLNNIDFL